MITSAINSVFVPPVAVCVGAFDDFRVVCDERVKRKVQYIIPELNFSCDGTVTQWKVGLEGKEDDQSVNLQIWRSVGAGEYTSVTEVVYTKTVRDERVATVPVSMSVMAGDMVGFYAGRQLQLHALPDVGLTVCTTREISASTLSQLSCTVGPSPYISVVFGEWFKVASQYCFKLHNKYCHERVLIVEILLWMIEQANSRLSWALYILYA